MELTGSFAQWLNAVATPCNNSFRWFQIMTNAIFLLRFQLNFMHYQNLRDFTPTFKICQVHKMSKSLNFVKNYARKTEKLLMKFFQI